MRIKVLDVLSFVLLINRQFYEVCTLVESQGCGWAGWGWLRAPPPLGLGLLQQS